MKLSCRKNKNILYHSVLRIEHHTVNPKPVSIITSVSPAIETLTNET